MKAIQITSQNGPDSLQLVNLPTPDPRPGRVLMRVHAASLNYRDLMVADGRYGQCPLPRTPLSDGAGEVVAIGAGVTRWQPGDRVAATFFQDWICGPFRREVSASALGGAVDGMLTELIELSADGLVAIPPYLSFEQAATLPCAALTAWQALISAGQLSADQTVLILGTGGVAIFSLLFAKMHGARVIITSSSDEKLARAQSLGADLTINYQRTPDWDREVYRLTQKRGVNHVIEVGGSDTITKSLRALSPAGTISLIGGVSGFSSHLPLIEVIAKAALVRGIHVGNREMFEAMLRALSLHQTRPIIDKVFGFPEAAAAYRHQQNASGFGKVVLTGW